MPAISTLAIQLTAVTGPFVKGIEIAENVLGSLGKAVGGVIDVIAKFAKRVAVAGGAVVAFSTFVGARFEQAMARVRALTNASADDFALLQEEAQRLGRTTQFTATQAAEAQSTFALAGLKTKQIIDALDPSLKLAIAGELGIAEAAGIATSVTRGLGKPLSEINNVLEVLARTMTGAETTLGELGDAFRQIGPIGSAAGQTMEDLSGALQIMADSGFRGGEAGRALRNIFLRLALETSEVKKALKPLNVAIEDSRGNFLPLTEIIGDLDKALAGMGNRQKLATLGQIGGVRATAALTKIIETGAGALAANSAALQENGDTLGRIARVQMDTFTGALLRIKSATEGVGIAIFNILKKFLRPVAEATARFFQILEQFIRTNAESFDSFIQQAIDAANRILVWLASVTGLSAALDNLGITGNTALEKLQSGLNLVTVLLNDFDLTLDIIVTAWKLAFEKIKNITEFFFSQQLFVLLENAFTLFKNFASLAIDASITASKKAFKILGFALFKELGPALAFPEVDVTRMVVTPRNEKALEKRMSKIGRNAGDTFSAALGFRIKEIPEFEAGISETDLSAKLKGLKFEVIGKSFQNQLVERIKAVGKKIKEFFDRPTAKADEVIKNAAKVGDALNNLAPILSPVAALERGTAAAFRAERGTQDKVAANTGLIADEIQVVRGLVQEAVDELSGDIQFNQDF